MKKVFLVLALMVFIGAAWYFRSEIVQWVEGPKKESRTPASVESKSRSVSSPSAEAGPTTQTEALPSFALSVSSTAAATFLFDGKTYDSQLNVKVVPGDYSVVCVGAQGWKKEHVKVVDSDLNLEIDPQKFQPFATNEAQSFDQEFPKRLAWSEKLRGNIIPNAQFYENLVLVSDRDGGLYAIDRTAGEPIWQANLESDLGLAPVIWGSFVLVADQMGKIWPFAIKNGKGKKPIHIGGQILGMSVDKDSLFLWSSAGEVSRIEMKTNPFKGLKTKELWLKTIHDDPSHFYRFQSNPIVTDDILVIQTSPSEIVAFQKDGRLIYRSSLGPSPKKPEDQDVLSSSGTMQLSLASSTVSIPAMIHDGRKAWVMAHIESTFYLQQIELSSGEPIWSVALSNQPTGSMVHHMGMIALGTQEGLIEYFDSASGNWVLSQPTQQQGPVFLAMASGTDILYANGEGWLVRQNMFNTQSNTAIQVRTAVNGIKLHSNHAYIFGEEGMLWQAQ